jgi:uncharacterized Rossmann fold enzyme
MELVSCPTDRAKVVDYARRVAIPAAVGRLDLDVEVMDHVMNRSRSPLVVKLAGDGIERIRRLKSLVERVR